MKRLYYIILICAFIFSCNTNKESKPNTSTNYMVSKKVDKAMLALSWEVLENNQKLANSGKSINEILELLPEEAEIMVNNTSIVYFLEGSIPMLISFDKGSNSTKGGGDYTQRITPNFATSMLLNFGNSSSTDNKNKGVLRQEQNEEERQRKKARIIRSLINFFGSMEDAQIAADFLVDQENYQGNVNGSPHNSQLKMFTEWASYDFVHFSGEAMRFCKNPTYYINQLENTNQNNDDSIAPCNVIINTGIKHGFKTKQEAQDFFIDSENSIYNEHVIIDKIYFYLKSSFFNAFYNNKDLKDKIWIFSACELGQQSDFELTMKHLLKDSHIFYWQNAVEAEKTIPAFKSLYKNLIIEGLDAERAFEEIPPTLRNQIPTRVNDSLSIITEMVHLQTGEPRHAIEVVQLLHPIEESILQERSNYPLNGDFGDGKPETLVVKMDLLGYTKDEFEAQGMTISLKVDGKTIVDHLAFLPDTPNDAINIKKTPNKKYGVRLHFEGLEIPDISAEKETLELKAYLHFNDKNFSIHSEVVNINPKDVKIQANSPQGNLTITYDRERGALKNEAPKIPKGHMFSDVNGYLYTYVAEQGGWKKINLNNFMGKNIANMMDKMMPLPMEVDIFLGREGISSQAPDVPKESFIFKPLVDWPEKMTIARLARNPLFQKREITCLSGKGDCVAFTGASGDAKGVQIYFNSSGRLQRITMKGNRLDYEYGDFTVILPKAKELKLLSF